MPYISWTEAFEQNVVHGLDLGKLKRDQCYVTVDNQDPGKVFLQRKFKDCVKCPYTTVTDTILSTTHDAFYRIVGAKTNDETVLCDLDPNFGQFGVYNIKINNSQCHLETLQDPVNIYFPILTVLLIFVALFLSLLSLVHIINRIRKRQKLQLNDEGSTENIESTPKKKYRVKSLDTFRGICIVGMIFVNYGAGGYEILEHAMWNGLQLADIFFPWFLFIMGFCIPISTNSALKRTTRKSAFLNITKRSAILFSLGLFLTGGPYLDNLRIFGVLQRFGICYFVVAGSQIFFAKEESQEKDTLSCLCEDILKLKYQWLVAIAILITHCVIIFQMSVPGCPTGYLGPGGYHLGENYSHCIGGATGYIDQVILGNHLYKGLTVRMIYGSDAFDPEGILGCLPSIIQVILGVQAGTIFFTYKEHTRRMSRWILWALATGLIGAILCGFSKDDGAIPINKNLWSISYVLVTTSLALLTFTACYYVIDVLKFWSGKPLLYPGMNSTIMYVGHMMVSSNFPVRWFINEQSMGSTHFLDMIACVWSTIMWVLYAFYLYKIKFFLSI